MKGSSIKKEPRALSQKDATVLSKYATWRRDGESGNFCHTCHNPGQ